jgi:hypothetical protein
MSQEYVLMIAADATGSTRPEAEVHHIKVQTVKRPFAASGRLGQNNFPIC